MSESEPGIWISQQRFERIQEALALVAAGTYVESLIELRSGATDAFAETEMLLESILREQVRLVTAHNRRSVQVTEQETLLERLRSPVIEISEHVVAVPIIGELHESDWAQLTQRCLEHTHRTRARCLILDLTGVETYDDRIGVAVLRLVHGLELLGCAVIVSGVSPALANGFVGHSDDVQPLAVTRTVHEALRRWLRATSDSLRGNHASSR